MSDYINVQQTVKVQRICKNCLYCGSNGITCANANNNGMAMLFVNGGRACRWFWLDQHRFPNAERRW